MHATLLDVVSVVALVVLVLAPRLVELYLNTRELEG